MVLGMSQMVLSRLLACKTTNILTDPIAYNLECLVVLGMSQMVLSRLLACKTTNIGPIASSCEMG